MDTNLEFQCPFSMDSVATKLSITTACNHKFCGSCLTNYLINYAFDVDTSNANNPFPCPFEDCRRAMKYDGFVKHFLPEYLMDDVQKWYKEKKNPPFGLIPVCLKKGCVGTMRKEGMGSLRLVFCDVCSQRWCELCLQRVTLGVPHSGTTNCKAKKMPNDC